MPEKKRPKCQNRLHGIDLKLNEIYFKENNHKDIAAFFKSLHSCLPNLHPASTTLSHISVIALVH